MPPSPWIGSALTPPVSSSTSARPPVVVRCVLEPGQQRLKSLVILGLCRGRHRGDGPPVEAAFQGDDLVFPLRAVTAGQLDGRLVGLRSAVTEEPLPKTSLR